MAANDKRKSSVRTARILEKLAIQSCPYLEGLEDAVIRKLLLTPGEARLRLLEWLVARVHPHLQQALGATTNESTRIAKLTLLMADLGVCAAEDYELVKGTTPPWRQLQFLDVLTDLTMSSSEDEDPTDLVSAYRTNQNMQHRCFFMDALCRRENISSFCPSTISLISPNIAMACEINTKDLAERKRLHPSIGELRTELVQALPLLQDRHRQLEELEQTHSFAPLEPNALESHLKALSVSLHTFSQLLDDFSHSYQTEIQPWTGREAPQLSPLGPCVERINTHMTVMDQLLQGVALLEGGFTVLLQLTQNHVQTGDHTLRQKEHPLFQKCIRLLRQVDKQ